MSAAAAAPAASAGPDMRAIVRNNDEIVERYLAMQISDPSSPWRGTIVDAYGLPQFGSAAGLCDRFIASFVHSDSRYHKSRELYARIQLAVESLNRYQTPDGNIDLLITNFNSPPDTAFTVLGGAPAAQVARKYNERELYGMLEPFLRKAGASLARGGVHTPNHRWVVCGALAQLYTLFQDESYVRRIDQWLAEGIDIDSDGQFSEQSTAGYNGHVDTVLTIVAHHLKRPELLDPVRRNLDTMLYLLHPDFEVVTEVSHRQDRDTRGTMGNYWLALQYLANLDGNGMYQTVADQLGPGYRRLSAYEQYDVLNKPSPQPKPVPDQYEKEFPATGIVRFRRGATSATLVTAGNSRFFTLRRGDAVMEGVRFASAFFGKGQFVPARTEKAGGVYRLTESLDAGYYQPVEPMQKIPWGVKPYYESRKNRRRTEVCRMSYEAVVKELPKGFSVQIRAEGTKLVPVAVELNFRKGGVLGGCPPALAVEDGYMLPAGAWGSFRLGRDTIRFGPGAQANNYTQVRGADAKLSGPSVYLTAFAPFDHTIQFEWD